MAAPELGSKMGRKRSLEPDLPFPRTLRVVHTGPETCEIRDENGAVRAKSRTEIKALWDAVATAEEMAKSGCIVRVVLQRGDLEIEEFVAQPTLRI
jgi:hypothetical protein